eukprot:gene3502-6970_t
MVFVAYLSPQPDLIQIKPCSQLNGGIRKLFSGLLHPLNKFATTIMSVSVSDIINNLSYNGGQIVDSNIIKRLDEESEDTIVSLTHKITDEEELVTFLCCVLVGSAHNTEKACKRRCKIFIAAIRILKLGKLSSHLSKRLTDYLFANIRNLREEHARECTEHIFDDFDPKNSLSTCGHERALELLPPLVSRAGGPCREYTWDKLCTISWPMKAVAMLASVLVELSESESECLRGMATIWKYVKWGSSPVVAVAVDPQDLPVLVYQMTVIGRRDANNGTPIVSLRRAVIHYVSSSIDSLVDDLRQGSEGEKQRFRHCSAILATIVTHLSIAAKDQTLATEVLAAVKSHQLCTASRTTRLRQIREVTNVDTDKDTAVTPMARRPPVSPAKLLLCLLVAGCPRWQSKVLAALCDAFSGTLSVEDRACSSLWVDAAVWTPLIPLSASQLRHAFDVLLRGPLLTELTAVPLVALGFALIDRGDGDGGKSKKYSWTSVSEPTVPCVARQGGSVSVQSDGGGWGGGAIGQGVWLVCRLFQTCEFARIQIIRNIVERLHASVFSSGRARPGVGVTATSSSSNAVSVSHGCVQALLQLSESCRHGLLQVSKELLEVFTALPELRSDTASRLVQAISPLMASCPSLGDRLALGLRKACFSKDSLGRRAAVSALLSLLRAQIGHHRLRVQRQEAEEGSQGEFMVYHGVGGLSGDEILAMSRRFLQQQSCVRKTLYRELYCLQRDEPSFRLSALQLLTAHLRSLLSTEAGRAKHLDMSRCNDESLWELILTLLAVAIEGIPPTHLPSGMKTLSLCLCLSSSSVSSRHERDSTLSQSSSSGGEIGEPEAWEALELLWTVVTFLGSPDVGESSRTTAAQGTAAACLLEHLYWAGMVVTLSVPDRVAGSGRERFQLLRKIEMQCQLHVEKMVVEGSGGGGGGGAGNKRQRKRSDEMADPNKPTAAVAAGKEEAEEEGDRDCCHMLLLQSDFVNVCLVAFDVGYGDPVQGNADKDKDNDKDGSSSMDDANEGLCLETNSYLHGVVLSMAIRCVEGGLGSKLRSLGQARRDAARQSSSLCQSLLNQRKALFDLGHVLCAPLLRALMRLRSWDREKVQQQQQSNQGGQTRNRTVSAYVSASGPWRKGSLLSPFPPKQLVLRSLLGCLRLETLGPGLGYMGLPGDGGGVHDVESAIATVLDAAFRSSLRNNNPASGNQPLLVQQSLPRIWKMFFSLLLSMHSTSSSDGKDGGERGECPLVVAILGELMMVLPRESRGPLTGHMLKQLREKLVDPSPQMSVSLIQMLLLQAPGTPDDRVHNAFALADKLVACANEEEGDGDGEGGGSEEEGDAAADGRCSPLALVSSAS